MKVKINSIKFNRSLVDGPGVRTVVFMQGCDMRCNGCHNVATWDMAGGIEADTADLAALLRRNCVNKKITISGGEPLLQAEALDDLLEKLKDFDIALYTGRSKGDVPQKVLAKIHYLKTGPFIEEQRTTIKPYVGSLNQIFEEIKHA